MKIISEIVMENGNFPNNQLLPLLQYKVALKEREPQKILALFEKNGWIGGWVDSIYPFHHFHSNTHEVLGICQGFCVAEMGGEEGLLLELEAGDVLIIPAGVSHKNLQSSKDFTCVGAYPADIEYNMLRGLKNELAAAKNQIKQVPLPTCDPVTGQAEPLLEFWIAR